MLNLASMMSIDRARLHTNSNGVVLLFDLSSSVTWAKFDYGTVIMAYKILNSQPWHPGVIPFGKSLRGLDLGVPSDPSRHGRSWSLRNPEVGR